MLRMLKLPSYHWIIVLIMSGCFAIGFAYSSYNLYFLWMANLHFIQKFGISAIMEGALWQSFEILIGASFSLIYYLGFKMCESELLSRYNKWKLD